MLRKYNQKPILSGSKSLLLSSTILSFGLLAHFAKANPKEELTARTDTNISIYQASDRSAGIGVKLNYETPSKSLTPEKTQRYNGLLLGPFGLGSSVSTITRYVVGGEADIDFSLGGAAFNRVDLNVFDILRLNSESESLDLSGHEKQTARADLRVGRFGASSMRDFSTSFAMGGVMLTGADGIFELITDPDFESAVTGRIKLAQAVAGSQDGKPGIAFQPLQLGMNYRHKLGEQTLSVGGELGSWFSSHATPQITFDKRVALERINGGNFGIFYQHTNRWGGGKSIQVNHVGISLSAK